MKEVKTYSDPIRNRLKSFIEFENFTEGGFTKYVGLSPSWWQSAGTPSGESMTKIKRLFPQLSMEWLYTGNGTMYVQDHTRLVRIDTEQPMQQKASEPTQPYTSARNTAIINSDMKMITIPESILTSLQQQLENKDAQIASLLAVLSK